MSIPAEAQPNTPEGATAFARFYVEAGSRASVDWDTAVLQQYAEPSCTVCAGVVENVKKWQALGYRTASPRYLFDVSQVVAGAEAGVYQVDLLGTERAARVIDRSGSLVEEKPEERSALRVTLRHSAESWRILSIQGIVT